VIPNIINHETDPTTRAGVFEAEKERMANTLRFEPRMISSAVAAQQKSLAEKMDLGMDFGKAFNPFSSFVVTDMDPKTAEAVREMTNPNTNPDIGRALRQEGLLSTKTNDDYIAGISAPDAAVGRVSAAVDSVPVAAESTQATSVEAAQQAVAAVLTQNDPAALIAADLLEDASAVANNEQFTQAA